MMKLVFLLTLLGGCALTEAGEEGAAVTGQADAQPAQDLDGAPIDAAPVLSEPDGAPAAQDAAQALDAAPACGGPLEPCCEGDLCRAGTCQTYGGGARLCTSCGYAGALTCDGACFWESVAAHGQCGNPTLYCMDSTPNGCGGLNQPCCGADGEPAQPGQAPLCIYGTCNAGRCSNAC